MPKIGFTWRTEQLSIHALQAGFVLTMLWLGGAYAALQTKVLRLLGTRSRLKTQLSPELHLSW